MRRLSGHTGIVRAVVFTRDGRLVSAGEDRTVRVWNLETGEPTTLTRATGPVYALAITPDGRTLAYAGRHPRNGDRGTPVHRWDLAAGRPTGEFELPLAQFPRSVWSLSYSHDGAILAAAARRLGGANITAGAGGHWWGPSADGPLADTTAFSLGFATNSALLAVAGDGLVGFYTSPGATANVAYPLAASRPESLTLVPNTTEVVVAAGTYLYLADGAKSSKLRKLKTGSRQLTCVAAFPDGRSIVAGGKPGLVEVFDLAVGKVQASYDFELGGVHAVAVSPDGLTFAVAGALGLVVCDAADW
ncbi:MAG: hypothetical protein C0467_10055 [Planctomycetaceae bacterium]|nr:hypothetical protein [Planctomycetaceae bacterium]